MTKKLTVQATQGGELISNVEVKTGSDGSVYAIPKGLPEKDGSHISFHPSGEIHGKSNQRFISKEKIITLAKNKSNEVEKIENPVSAFIIDASKVNYHLRENGGKVIATIPEVMDQIMSPVEIPEDMDFLKIYPDSNKSILIITASEKYYWVVKDRPGFGLPCSVGY